MGAHKVRLGEHHLRGRLGRINVVSSPDQRLGHGHIEEVFPCVGFNLAHLFRVVLDLLEHALHGLIGPQVKGGASRPEIVEHLMVPEGSGDGHGCPIRRPLFEKISPLLLYQLTLGVL